MSDPAGAAAAAGASTAPRADTSLSNPDLAPVPPERRTWTMWSIAALWVGMAICITTYTLAGGLIKEGMNWWQATLTVFLGNAIVLIPMTLNAHPGTAYGVPFPVLLRASFGTLGANIPAMMRAFVACGWFGIQTWVGGAASNGVVFRLSLDGSHYTNLHEFGVAPGDGVDPRNSLTMMDGLLYGTTESGGANAFGTIFAIRPDGTGYEILHNFTALGGDSPHGDVIPHAGRLFGVTRWGGLNDGDGVAFVFDPVTRALTILHDFEGGAKDGESPLFGVTLADGSIYGTAALGGPTDDGVIWRMNQDGTGYTNLHAFSGVDGHAPHCQLRLTNGFLYGTVPGGGTGGVAFRIRTNGTDFAVLHAFGSSPTDGQAPYGDLLMFGQTLYGMTRHGGSNGLGTIFRVWRSGSFYRAMHHFTGCEGAEPGGALVMGPDGRLYGMTQSGGRYGKGVVFAFNWRGNPVRPGPVVVTPIVLPDGSVSLGLEGEPGVNYRVEASTNLHAWTTLTNLTSIMGVMEFSDASVTNFPSRFYRAVEE